MRTQVQGLYRQTSKINEKINELTKFPENGREKKNPAENERRSI